MHARIDELLSLRDGEPVDSRTDAHVAGCSECLAQLARVTALQSQLRTLPEVVSAGRDGWLEVERRLRARTDVPGRRTRTGLLAVAASLAMLAVVAGLRIQDRPATGRDAFAGLAANVIDGVPPTLAELQQRSVQLEQLLAALPERPAVERAATALPIDALEAQVQWVDHRLTESGVTDVAPEETERLWRDRIELMNSLVQLRYVDAQRMSL